jgi:hypothetical protein
MGVWWRVGVAGSVALMLGAIHTGQTAVKVVAILAIAASWAHVAGRLHRH